MKPAHVDSSTPRLGELMHQLRGLAGPSPEDLVGIELPRHQLRALFIVVKHGPLTVSHLAEATEASLASASSLAERLVRSGHLQREADPDDRRKVLLVATPQGREVAEQLESRFRQRFERLVEAMSPEGRSALETGLTDLICAADELGLRSRDHHGGSR
ncbi:MAG: MarR family transcriptional regulator [Chloroflexota bacterium]|nr:MarR family transcriptional regulator [Chloroflexota bacterium]